MWILPKQLISAFVPDTAALISDLNEQFQICGQSLFARSRALPARTWFLKWKRDSWTQHLSGRILKHSHGGSFTERWISSLGDTHANHLAQLASDSAPKTRATFGHSLQMELGSCSPEFVFLKTSKDTSASDLEKSLENWNQWVTQLRGEYLARLKSVPHTNENGCLSWPTPMSRDWKDTGDMSQSMTRKDGKKRMDILGRAVQANPSTNGSLPESWATPRSGKTTDENPETWAKRNTLGDVATMPLTLQVKSWATPRLGKLNPRWVETLMGLPVGWTMPSCAYPVTIEPTNSDCSATA